LALLVWWQKDHLACRKPVPLIPKGSVPEQVEQEVDGDQITQIHLAIGHLNGGKY